jgi:diguanylate cyclase (GGDEF)-like protein
LYALAAEGVALAYALLAINYAQRHITVSRERLGWTAIGLFLILHATGNIIWIAMRWHTKSALPIPSWVDFPYLLAMIPLWFGLNAQPILHARERFSRIALALEILITLAAVLSLFWHFNVGPVLEFTYQIQSLPRTVTIAYPTADLVTLFLALMLLFCTPFSLVSWVPRLLLCLAALLIALSHHAYILSASAQPASSVFPQPFWPIVAFPFGMAALLHGYSYVCGVGTMPESVFLPTRWRLFLPYGLATATGIAALVVLGKQLTNPTLLGLLFGTALVFFLVIVHQWFTFEENRRLYQQLRNAYHEKARDAYTDPITGLHNYRYFIEHLEDEIERANRYHSSLALIFADIDHFKSVNDTYGHLVGDLVLKKIGETLGQHIRSIDLLARYAGEEFVILLPQTTLDSAYLLAERLRQCVERMVIPVGDGRTLQLTVSLGLSSYPAPSPTLQALIHDADAAMYHIKQNGRNGTYAAHSSTSLVTPP